jgi:hypothetical protein
MNSLKTPLIFGAVVIGVAWLVTLIWVIVARCSRPRPEYADAYRPWWQLPFLAFGYLLLVPGAMLVAVFHWIILILTPCLRLGVRVRRAFRGGEFWR